MRRQSCHRGGTISRITGVLLPRIRPQALMPINVVTRPAPIGTPTTMATAWHQDVLCCAYSSGLVAQDDSISPRWAGWRKATDDALPRPPRAAAGPGVHSVSVAVLTPFSRVQTHEMFKHLNRSPIDAYWRPPPHPAEPRRQPHCGWAATLEARPRGSSAAIPAAIVATLELSRAAPQRPIPARIVATLGPRGSSAAHQPASSPR